MKKSRNSVRLLMSVFHGRSPRAQEWFTIIDVANRAWLVPALYVALARDGRLHHIPDEVRNYCELLHERNVERNRRLRAQLIEAVGALNAAGIEPTLLKGAVTLFCGEKHSCAARMISDLDINVAPAEMRAAKAALAAIGYCALESDREMGRTTDVGVIELHDRPNARSARYLSGNFGASAPRELKDGVAARVPTPTARAIHLIVHDMIKEGDYWRLRINLRHLHDLMELSSYREGIDWADIAASLSDRAGRGALAMQLKALQDLFAVPGPGCFQGGALTEIRHAARLMAAEPGIGGSIIRFAGRLMWGSHRFRESYSWGGVRDLARRVRQALVMPTKGSTL